MRKEMIDEINFDNFEEDGDLRKFYNKLLECFEGELNVSFYGLEHQYKTFRLFCFINRDCLQKAVSEWNNTMYYIIDVYNKDVNAFKEIIIRAIKNRDDALDFFWEYREDFKKYISAKEDKFNFRTKAMALLKLFPQLIENIIKREAILLNELNIIEGHVKPSKDDDKLFKIIENVFATPTYHFNEYISKKLSGVSVNQFRNIVAHSSFSLKNEKICATYGNNKEVEFTLDEAESFLGEIYRLRIFVKLTLNHAIDFILAKHPELRQEIRIIPETAIVDLNSTLNEIGININGYEISDSVIMEDFNYSNEGEVYFILDIESKKISALDTIRNIFICIYTLIPMFNKKNNFPDIESVIWVLKIKHKEAEKLLDLFISYDEIKILQSNPIGYSEMMYKKIKNHPNMKEIIYD